MLNISGSEFRVADILSDLIAYNTVLGIPVLLLSSVSIPHRYSTVMDRASEFFLIVVFHQSFPCFIIWRWCRTSQRTAVFPGASVGSVLPSVFRGNVKIMLHVMSIFMFVKIQSVFFFQRIFYRIADKQQRKMEMLFFMVTAPCIRSKKIRLHAKRYRDLRSVKMKFFIEFCIETSDLSCKYWDFFLQGL